MTFGQCLAIAGLVSNQLGVLLLFRYGMPFELPTGGNVIRVTGIDSQLAKRQRRFTALGYFGLFLVIAGTGLQIVAILS